MFNILVEKVSGLKPGDCSVVELPLPIPNKEVKHYSAENTSPETELEDRSLPGLLNNS
jgi:hypothetical protein